MPNLDFLAASAPEFVDGEGEKQRIYISFFLSLAANQLQGRQIYLRTAAKTQQLRPHA